MPPTWIDAIVPLLSAVIGAVVGGVVVHRAASARDARNEQRGRRVEHLISAYQRCIAVANRPDRSAEQSAALETAISDVMLLGQRAEVEAARQFIVALAGGGSVGLDPLLDALRTSLRRELAVDETPMPRPHNLRM